MDREKLRKPLPPVLPRIGDAELYGALSAAYSHTGTLPVAAAMRELGQQETNTYGKLCGDRVIAAWEFISLARRAAMEGDYSLIELVLIDGLAVVPQPADDTESLEHVVTDIVQEEGEAIADLRRGDTAGAKRSALRAEESAAKLVRKIEKKRGR